MPFSIIRNDITRVRADAIVNTANPEPCFASGTDAAIYEAAGADELLAERQKIGRIAPGEAAVTAAFCLPAKYIVHTVGPEWIDGAHGEPDLLRSCYRKSLLLAEQLQCESIAFPLISAGSYGFPKALALETALSAIREYLETSEMDVLLVVFERDSWQLAAGLTERVAAYIDEKYVAEKSASEYGGSISDMRRRRRLNRGWHDAYFEEITQNTAAPLPHQEKKPSPGDTQNPSLEDAWKTSPEGAKKPSLEDAVRNLGESFQKRLLRMIDERGMTDPDVYKRANIDRKLFSKIRCSEDYIPRKKTILALAVAMRLNLDDTKDLLASAGYALTNNVRSDLILSFCIENGIYDIYEVNALLFKFGQPILG